ncbi:IS4 family transposase [Pleurocapsa sp. PCC 7319]|uniref:IS4 family transposase n=2 Tax=Pleurocapsa sp. PCC 7319 TaxID=118161 RepID=UPI00034D1F87|nr:IS4 family transposase [Pleurocapsa sp. PCC 7319]
MNQTKNSITEKCDFGDQRLTKRAMFIESRLSLKYGKPLSEIFERASDLKRAYEFFANPKTSLSSVCQPYHLQTAAQIKALPIVLAVGDTTYLDYKKILDKRAEYGPIGNGGNGLILHSTLALDADNGQPIGLLTEKLWHREHEEKGENLTKKQRKKKQAEARKRPIEEKESYKWIEALKEVEKLLKISVPEPTRPKIIHVFDREGDIAEVFAQVSKTSNTGLVVRAAHNRALEGENSYLWSWLPSQPIKMEVAIELAKTKQRTERIAVLAIRYAPIKLRSPARIKEPESFEVYGVYAVEIDPPEGCERVEWMILTTEPVTNEEQAQTILRWYTYRWRIEEYHKILKSGCKAESYRLSGNSMQVLLGFLTNIAAQLLKMTYLNRTEPEAPASSVLNEVQLEVLAAKGRKSVPVVDLTVAWAMQAVARLGGYLSHRKKSNIGITVLWRGFLELQSLCEGWQLRSHFKV